MSGFEKRAGGVADSQDRGRSSYRVSRDELRKVAQDLQIVVVEALGPDLYAGTPEPVREREKERSRHKPADYTLRVQEVSGSAHAVSPRLHQRTNQRTFISRAA